jgi:hypothetical protein
MLDGHILTRLKWHDRLYVARQAIFLIVPTIAHNLPASPAKPISPLFLLSRTTVDLTVTESKAQALDMTHSAVMRNAALRGNADRWWGWQRQEADWARAEPKLAEEAQRIDLGFEAGDPETGDGEGRLLAKIRNAVKDIGRIAWGWEDRSARSTFQSNSSPGLQTVIATPQPT